MLVESINKGKQFQKGFVALISVLVITAVSIIIGTTVTLKTISHSTMSASENFSAQAWAAVNSCAEYALGELSIASTTFTTFTGPVSVSVGSNNCYIYSLTATGTPLATSLLIRASSTVSGFTRKLELIVATNTPQSVISSWQEVGDFSI